MTRCPADHVIDHVIFQPVLSDTTKYSMSSQPKLQPNRIFRPCPPHKHTEYSMSIRRTHWLIKQYCIIVRWILPKEPLNT